LNPSGSSGTVYTGNGLNAPGGIAIDGSSNIWITNSGNNSVSAFTNTGTALTDSPFSGGGTTAPVSIAATPK
jgi:sugar lactone lactonase YvrE